MRENGWMTRPLVVLVLGCLTAVVPGPPGAFAQEGGPGRGSAPTADRFSSDVAVAWSELLYDRIRAERLPPPNASRIIGYAGVTLYEAIVPGMPDHRSLGGQLNGLAPLPEPDLHRKYHWPSVANSSLAAMLRILLAGRTPETLGAIDALEEQFAQQFGMGVAPPISARSIARGRSVAEALAVWAGTDGFAEFNNCAYTPPVGEGLWVPTPPAFAQPLQPCWGRLRPFALDSADACAPPAHPAYSTDPASAFYAEGLEVYETVNNLTAEQREIALYWADNPGQTGTPPGHSMSIATQMIEQQGLSLDLAAESYARVGIAVADAFISCWHAKYVYNLLRPITYSRDVIGDSSWQPFIPTPPFPEYTSGHSVQSGAAAEVLTDLFGELPFTDFTHAGLGFAPRSFDSFFEAAEEAAISRLYGGIHFRAAIDRGIEQGVCVGRAVTEGIHFLNEDGEHD